MNAPSIDRWQHVLTQLASGKVGRWASGFVILCVAGFFLRHQLFGARHPWFLGAVGTLLVLTILFVFVPGLLVRAEDLTRADLLKLRNDVRLAGIQLLGGTVVLGGLVFTYQTLTLNRQGQITDRLAQATNQLGSEQLDVRAAGIFALGAIAHDSPDNGPTIMAILTNYLRHHAPWNAKSASQPPSADHSPHPPAPDVQAVATVLRDRVVSADPECLDLSSVDLRGVELSGVHLAGASLTGSNLIGAYLKRADLRRASFVESDLTDARLTEANLGDADLSRARLVRAELTKTRLTDADLREVDLTGASLAYADLRRVDLAGAVLSGGADLTAADLTGANLRGADLRGAGGLSQAQIDSAVTNDQTKVDDALTINQRGGEGFIPRPSAPCALPPDTRQVAVR